MNVADFDDVDPFDTDDDLPDERDQGSAEGPTDPLFGGVDVTALAGELVGPAVRRAVTAQIEDLAAQAVIQALTPEVLDQLRADTDDAAQTLVHGHLPSTPVPGAGQAPRLYYGSTAEFVREYLRHVYKRKIDGNRTFWSLRWWASDEAIARLEAMWLAWEHLRLDPATGPSVWWRDHADPHMAVLLSSVGPFGKESQVRSGLDQPLPHEEPPDGLFPDVRHSHAPHVVE